MISGAHYCGRYSFLVYIGCRRYLNPIVIAGQPISKLSIDIARSSKVYRWTPDTTLPSISFIMLALLGITANVRTFIKLRPVPGPIPIRGSMFHEAKGQSDGLA